VTVISPTAESTSVSGSVFLDHEVDGRATGNFAPDAVISQLDKILGSSTFVRSKRLGRFLRFTVEQCLEGRQGALKEYLVGVEVFNKMETFDPRIDSIVRVEARRLRSKLEKYYQTEGRDDKIIVQFRKGSYVPQILSREQLNTLGVLDGSGPRTSRKSVAVSRFTSLGVDASHAYFCSGLTEDIISALTKVPTLRVMARTGSGDDPKADYVLEGSVRKQGERLRIAAQLIDSSSSMYIWSETYERDLADAFAVQDEISRSIVAAIRREFQST
jgi:adenylate cyclase